MSRELLPSTGLAEVPLKCGNCGVRQVWALPEESVLSVVLKSLSCWVCRAQGEMFRNALTLAGKEA